MARRHSRCIFCKARLKDSTTHFFLSLSGDGQEVLIKNIPGQTCTRCGNETINSKAQDKINKIAHDFRTGNIPGEKITMTQTLDFETV